VAAAVEAEDVAAEAEVVVAVDVAAVVEPEDVVAEVVQVRAEVLDQVEVKVKEVHLKVKVKVDLQQEVLLQKALNHVQDQQHVQHLEALKEALLNHKQQAEQNQEHLAADLL